MGERRIKTHLSLSKMPPNMTMQGPNSRIIRCDPQYRPTSTLYPEGILSHGVVQSEVNISQVINTESSSTSSYHLELVAVQVVRMVDDGIKIVDDNVPWPEVGESSTGYQCVLAGASALDD